MKKILFILVLEILLTLALIAACTEVFIRLMDPYGVSHFSNMPKYFSTLCNVMGPPRIIAHRPDTTVEFNDFSITTNRFGFRGADFPETKSDQEYRLLFLGDSVLLGWGASREDLFITLAEQELNALSEDGTVYRCINTGHNQYDTSQEAALLKELGDRLRPDAVILIYVSNDVIPTVRAYEALMSQAREQQAQAPDSWLYRTGQWTVEKTRALFQGLNNLKTYYLHAQEVARKTEELRESHGEERGEGWEFSRQALLEIRDWCKARNILFVVLDHTRPAWDDLPAEIPPLIPFLEAEGIPRFPFHYTKEELKLPLRHSASDAHSNARGHRILLGKMRPALQHLGLKTR